MCYLSIHLLLDICVVSSLQPQAYPGDNCSSVPDHCSKVNIGIKQVIQILFLNAYKNYVYTFPESIKCAIILLS